MSYELKPIHNASIEAALQKANRYRSLNEPMDAESICRDVLQIEPDNQRALICLLLSLTDQFPDGIGERYGEARRVASELRDEYQKVYYSGIICERRAKAGYRSKAPARGYVAHEWFCQAMEEYEAAEKIRPEDNDDPLLRWNFCARFLMSHRDIRTTMIYTHVVDGGPLDVTSPADRL